jgi:hypothetical protein
MALTKRPECPTATQDWSPHDTAWRPLSAGSLGELLSTIHSPKLVSISVPTGPPKVP